MNGIRSKTPASPPPTIQGQQPQRSYPFAEEYQQGYQQAPQTQQQQYPGQFGVAGYDVNKSFGAPRMPSPGLGQQPQTTMYQPHQQHQAMRGNAPPFFPANQQNVRQRFPNVQGQPNSGMWPNPIMYNVMPYPQSGNQPSNVVMIQQQRLPGQQFNPGSNIATQQQPNMFVPPATIPPYSTGYGNMPVYYGQNAPQSRPPSASGQAPQMTGKKERKAIKIVDPNTGKDVDLKSQTAGGVPAGEVGTAQSPPKNEIAAMFAAQVVARIYNDSSSDAPKQFQPGGPHPGGPGPQQQQQQQQHPPHQHPQQQPPQQQPSQIPQPGPPSQMPQPGPPSQMSQSGPPSQMPQPGPPSQMPQSGPPSQMPQPGPPSQMPQPGPPSQMPQPAQTSQMSQSGQTSQMPQPGGHPHGHVPPMANEGLGGVEGPPRMHPHPPHLVQRGMPPPGQSVPINIPGVNPAGPDKGSSHMEGTVTDVPQSSDSMHSVIPNHMGAPPVDTIGQPMPGMGSVAPPSQSLSNGTPPSQKPVQNVTINPQTVAATSEQPVKPSDVTMKLPTKARRETSPSKPAPQSIQDSENTQSLSRGEPVTVSVAKQNVETSDSSAKSVTNTTKRESTPEVHIMPPTPVEKEAKVELEPPTSTKTPETSEPKQEFAVPKKEKAKKKAKELNKKGEKMGGSEYDAYVDKKDEVASEPKTVAVEKDKLSPERAEAADEDSAEPEPIPIVKQDSPAVSAAVREESPKAVDEPSEESFPKTEIKIEDADGQTVTEDGSQDELEKGDEDDDSDQGADVMLRYKYCEDQWSPLNPEGKKHYDREFLLQFQYENAATLKPEGLPDIPDIILDKPLNVNRTFVRDQTAVGNADSFDFMPRYVWQSTGQGGGGGRQSKGLPRQPSNQKNKGGQGGPAPRQINLSISKDIELHKAKEAWKPAAKEKDKKEADDNDDLYKKTRSILNKLTPQKFQTLVSQMQALPIDIESKLKGVIDLVFEKAISEPNFSVAYANMCRCLSMFKVPSESKPREMVNFRAVLLTRCQREFEKDKSSEAIFKEKRENIQKAEPGPKRDELTQELEYEESKAKRRSLGNIRFIGELFKLKMLTENIMHDCVFKLLRTKDPENLECLCRLLTTIGKELDVDKAKPRMDQYFQQMQKIVNEKKTSSRVRFMLQDVIDLRLNKWVPRRVDNNPKTIDQIHKEVEQEAQEKALLAQQAQIAQKSQPRGGGGGGGGRRGPPGGQMGGGADGWNTVGGSRTPLKNVDRSIDPSKIRFSKQNVDESIQLGPGGGASRFAGWGRGSTGGTTGRPSQEKEKPNTPANRFSVLNKPDEDSSRRYGGTSPARGDPKGRGGFGRPPSLSARHSQEMEREKEKALSAAKAIGSRQSADGGRERSRGREPERQQEERAAPAAQSAPSSAIKELSASDMEKKTKSILDEYLHIQDLKEAMLCVRELSLNNHHHFVYNAINHVIERSAVARRQTGHLLHDLVKDGVISSDAYLKGLLEVLEFAEDMEIDIPKIWQYYGELISPMIQDGSVPLSFLKEVCQPLLESNKAGVLLAEVLHDASHREGHKKVAGLWINSGLQWSDFVPKNQVEQFLKDKDLEFTKGGDSAPTTPTTGLPIKEIEDKLQALIVVQRADNEAVFDWIESNVDEPTTKQSKFIRALMTAVCYSAIKGDKGKERVEPKEITNRNDLLQKYLDHQAVSELQALYALQALVTKLEHPPGVLRHMFDTLYDEDIISEDAFIQWEKSEEEQDGKGAALKQVVQFFTWLRETEDDS